MEVHAARPAEVDAVASTIAEAFYRDPVWSWALPDSDRRLSQLRALWGLSVLGAIGHRWVLTTRRCEAAAVWIPPGCNELVEPYATRLDPLLDELLGSGADLVREVLRRFDASPPRKANCFYLSLFGTHPDHRGKGIGMGLLGDSLSRIDRAQLPAYLESSNPANLARYRSVGFRTGGPFARPDGGRVVTTMWREPRSDPTPPTGDVVHR